MFITNLIFCRVGNNVFSFIPYFDDFSFYISSLVNLANSLSLLLIFSNGCLMVPLILPSYFSIFHSTSFNLDVYDSLPSVSFTLNLFLFI
jgi:hypothetical protein